VTGVAMQRPPALSIDVDGGDDDAESLHPGPVYPIAGIALARRAHPARPGGRCG